MNNNPADSLEFANDFFFKEVETFLKENMKVLFRVKGGSMRPFLQDGDVVRIAPVAFDTLRRGDIILARTAFGVLLHRIVGIRKDNVRLAGDANRRLERAAFLSLLRAGLWGSASYCNLGGSNPGSGYFPLTGEEWEIIYLLARRQTVEGLVYDGILRLPVPLLPPSPLLMRWTAEIDGIERQNKQMDGTLGNLNRWLEKKGLKAWLMKGQGVAACYEQPLHRRCGDIDLYFPEPRDAERMIGLLRAEGVVMERQPGMSILYRHENCQIDQHARLVDIHNPFVSKYISSLIREETGNAILWETGGTSVTLPSPVLAHLISNAHILKHLMAVGVGLRQLCDSARICCRYHECIDGGRLEQIYRKVGIYRWVQGLHRVLVEELGMPESYLPFPLSGSGSRDTRWMKDVWEGGNFGFYDERTGHPASIGRRKRMFGQLAYHLLPQIRYAPAEAFWFPVMQLYSRFNRK